MLTIIGGAYHEICREPQPQWEELYGSGFRAALALSEKGIPLTFYTYADTTTKEILLTISEQLSLNTIVQDTQESIEFFYEHPLKNPVFYPKLEKYANQKIIDLKNVQDVICFGMLEGNARVQAQRVVYDPQRPEDPKSFWSNGSDAKELVMVMNLSEAKQLTGANDLESISKLLFEKEKLKAAIIKCGPDGAFLLEDGKSLSIPSFITERVWPIGTGDIFTSYFGFQWMKKKLSLYESAVKASEATAFYSNSTILPVPDNIVNNFSSFNKRSSDVKTVYLAGPFFTMAERWLINEFRDTLMAMGINVFSPLHDVGLGSANEVVEPDIDGIHKSDLLLAVVDGLDTGTVFEIGYAKAKNIPIIVYAENVPDNALTMLEGTHCIIERDFSTCIYKTVWELYK